MKRTIFKFCCILCLISSFAYAQSDATFLEAVHKLFDQEKVFQVESKRLMKNTQEIDHALINFETLLNAEHKTTQALITLDTALGTIEKVLVIAELVPQTKEEAQILKKNIAIVHKPVATAAKKMSQIDAKIVPLQKATHKTEKVTSALVKVETGFREMSLRYFDAVGLVAQCEHDDTILGIVNHSYVVYVGIDKEVNHINNTYDNIKHIPQKSLHALSVEFEKLAKLEAPLLNLHKKLVPLYHALNDLEHVLNQHIGVKPAYPCGVKTCHHEVSYPCGVKKCKKLGASYPCGVKTCTKKAPYPCGVKTCHVEISVSVADAIKGADMIEHKIESSVSSFVYKALKEVGLGSIVKDLEHQAQNLLKPVLKKLNLSIDTSLPSLDINLNLAMIEAGIADLEKFENELIKLGKILDMQSPTFAPYTQKLEVLNADIKAVLGSPRCKNIK
ncbi:MAG: hypothetical protein IBX44_03780 [Sulfurospirillum sp.]|nr:hypothetical protein [Sulfurospirillum sp.]